MREIEFYAQLLGRGTISRREFMGRAIALGATVSLAATLASKAAKAAPNKGGRFRIGYGHGSTTSSLDPATFTNDFDIVMGFGLHNHLTEVSNAGELIGELAESWEASDDAAQWTFKLRKGVEFHNGKTLDANDVVATFNHHRGEDSASVAKGVVEAISDVKADGMNTVVFTLAEGNADFPYIASDYHLAIKQANGEGGIEWEAGVGTGGYMLESYNPGVRASFTRNPNYWKEGRAHFDEVELLTIADVTARTNAVTTGEIEMMDRVDLKTMHLFEQNPDIKIEENTGYSHYTVPMRTDTAPFDDNNVRMALKLGVDREALLQTVLRGHGALGNDHPISTANRFHADDLPQRVYDPDKAKWHLKQAGLSSLTVDLSASDAAFSGAVDASVLYREHAAKAGIEINVVREPADGYWSDVWMNKAWCMCYWGGRPTEDWMFSMAYSAGAAWNDTFWEHDRFNELLVTARAELDEPKRRDMYVEMQGIVSNEGGVVVPMFNNNVWATSSKIEHDEMAANWAQDGQKSMERWWFA